MPSSHKQNANVELRMVRNRELELKRITGEVSCAECRRIKLKCDKKVPCSSCVRRGCMKICPLGTITGNSGRHITASGGSSPTADKDDMTRRLIARIAALEDALHLQSGDSTHPLLSPDLLAIKEGDNISSYCAEESEEAEPHTGLVSAFGTLSVSDGKAMRFLGASAADNVLLMEVFDPSTVPDIMNSDSLPKELIQASGMWPFVPSYLSQPEHIAQLVSHLPSYERATSLMEAYFANQVWIAAPIERSQVTDEIFPLFYPEKRPVLPEFVESEKLHELALFFILFACGAVADLTQPAVNPEAERFSRLARAALGMRSFLGFASFASCQALLLMATYEGFSGRETSQESSAKLISISSTIATSIGLHLDPSRWKLEPKLANWRRRTFWEIYASDKWNSLGSGRPWMFTRNTVDCEFPLDSGATMDEDGTVVESVWQWRYRFARDVISVLAEKICIVRPLKYSDVLGMDKLVRDFELHPFVHDLQRRGEPFATDGEYRNLPPQITMWLKEMALLYVHRNHFARAMLEYRGDPLRSPFALSVISAYQSSVTLLELLNTAVNHVPLIMDRLLGTWATSLSCALIVGSVASRVSAVNFAKSALRELDKAITLFETGCNRHFARNGVKMLTRLRDRAKAAFQTRSSQYSPSNIADAGRLGLSQLQAPRSPYTQDGIDPDEEGLNVLRGTTRYVERRPIPSSRPLQGLRPRPHLTRDDNPSSSSSSNAFLPPDEIMQAPSSSDIGRLSVSRLDINMNQSGGTSSRDATQNHPFEYDDYFRRFAESLCQKSSQKSTHFDGNEQAHIDDVRCPNERFPQQHPVHSTQAHPPEPQIHQSTTISPFSATYNQFREPSASDQGQHIALNAAGSNGTTSTSETPLQDPFMPFDHILDSVRATESFFESLLDPHRMEDADETDQNEGSNSSQAWNSFAQHFYVDNNDGTGKEDWEALLFSQQPQNS